MRVSAAASLALAAGASAWNISYTTEVVTSYTTYCPYATELTHNGVVYTATEATVITITNCPCTLTKPVIPATSVASVAVSTPEVSVPVVSVPVVSVSSIPAASVPVVSVPVVSVPVVSVSTPPAITPAPVTSVVVPPPAVSTVVVVPPPSQVNTTVVALPSGTGSPSKPISPPPAAFTGAASRMGASSAGLVALLGLAAFLL